MKFRRMIPIFTLLMLLPGLPIRAASVKMPTALLEYVQKGTERNLYHYYTVGVDKRVQFLYETEQRIKSKTAATPFTTSEDEKKNIQQILNFGEVADVEYTSLAIRPNTRDRLLRLRAITLDGAKNALILIDQAGKINSLPWMGVSPRFSPDGNFLAGTQLVNDHEGVPRFEIALYEIKTGKLRSLTDDLKDSACDPQWSPDGKWIAYDLVSPTYQAYVDCFWGRGVAAERFPDGDDWMLLSSALPKEIQDSVHLVGWEQ